MGSKSVGRSVGWADAGRDERERKRGKEERERFHQSITHIWVRFNAFTKRIAGSVCELLGFYLRYMYVETCQKRQRLGSVN